MISSMRSVPQSVQSSIIYAHLGDGMQLTTAGRYHRSMRSPVLLLATLLAAPATAETGWVDLFNGRDLDGWIVKITGYPLGENYADTFRVEDGLLKVRYDGYRRFGGRFGHLFWQEPYGRYHLIVEYRFVGEQTADGPAWANRNSGVMLHAQPPDTMALNQDFPRSIEAQLLGGLSNDRPRPTANVCTPGTHIVHRNRLYTSHCLDSSSPTFDGEQWVRAEIIVLGAERITHIVNGKVVLEYGRPQHDLPTAQLDRQADLIEAGYIALQSESHPVDFRLVRIKALDP
jgi:hypothetical protein